jgi:hypothetical protein
MEKKETASAEKEAISPEEKKKARKQELLDHLLDCPLKFTRAEFAELVDQKTGLTFQDLRETSLRIYDSNEMNFLDASRGAFTSYLGRFNAMSTKLRNWKFYHRIKSKEFQENPKKKIILAEGDSWFQFPYFVRDIIDWLIRNEAFAVRSIAAGGDWLANIIYEGRYIEELSLYQPDVFLISGGGNDAVEGDRLAIFVSKCKIERRPEDIKDEHFHMVFQLFDRTFDENNQEHAKFIKRKKVLERMRNEFFSFMLVLKAQYHLLFAGIRKSKKFAGLKIITHGYDYAIPHDGPKAKFPYIVQYVVNSLSMTGKWLYTPMTIKGVTDKDDQETIVKIWIDEVNEMYRELVGEADSVSVIHIDFRGLADPEKDWYDELHLHSRKFGEAAERYAGVIEGSLLPVENVLVVNPSKAGLTLPPDEITISC